MGAPQYKFCVSFDFWDAIEGLRIEGEMSEAGKGEAVRVQINNLSASVVALTAFVRLLPHVCSHLYLKTWCVYARDALTVR